MTTALLLLLLLLLLDMLEHSSCMHMLPAPMFILWMQCSCHLLGVKVVVCLLLLDALTGP
jgi:hypothetical protein